MLALAEVAVEELPDHDLDPVRLFFEPIQSGLMVSHLVHAFRVSPPTG